MFWVILFAGSLATLHLDMAPKLSLGPFPTLEACAAAAAIGIDHLNPLHPDKEFAAECAPDPEIKRHPDVPLRAMHEWAEIALGH